MNNDTKGKYPLSKLPVPVKDTVPASQRGSISSTSSSQGSNSSQISISQPKTARSGNPNLYEWDAKKVRAKVPGHVMAPRPMRSQSMPDAESKPNCVVKHVENKYKQRSRSANSAHYGQMIYDYLPQEVKEQGGFLMIRIPGNTSVDRNALSSVDWKALPLTTSCDTLTTRVSREGKKNTLGVNLKLDHFDRAVDRATDHGSDQVSYQKCRVSTAVVPSKIPNQNHHHFNMIECEIFTNDMTLATRSTSSSTSNAIIPYTENVKLYKDLNHSPSRNTRSVSIPMTKRSKMAYDNAVQRARSKRPSTNTDVHTKYAPTKMIRSTPPPPCVPKIFPRGRPTKKQLARDEALRKKIKTHPEGLNEIVESMSLKPRSHFQAYKTNHEGQQRIVDNNFRKGSQIPTLLGSRKKARDRLKKQPDLSQEIEGDIFDKCPFQTPTKWEKRAGTRCGSRIPRYRGLSKLTKNSKRGTYGETPSVDDVTKNLVRTVALTDIHSYVETSGTGKFGENRKSVQFQFPWEERYEFCYYQKTYTKSPFRLNRKNLEITELDEYEDDSSKCGENIADVTEAFCARQNHDLYVIAEEIECDRKWSDSSDEVFNANASDLNEDVDREDDRWLETSSDLSLSKNEPAQDSKKESMNHYDFKSVDIGKDEIKTVADETKMYECKVQNDEDSVGEPDIEDVEVDPNQIETLVDEYPIIENRMHREYYGKSKVKDTNQRKALVEEYLIIETKPHSDDQPMGRFDFEEIDTYSNQKKILFEGTRRYETDIQSDDESADELGTEDVDSDKNLKENARYFVEEIPNYITEGQIDQDLIDAHDVEEVVVDTNSIEARVDATSQSEIKDQCSDQSAEEGDVEGVDIDTNKNNVTETRNVATNTQAEDQSLGKLDVEGVDIDWKKIEPLLEAIPKYKSDVQSDDECMYGLSDGIDNDWNQTENHGEDTRTVEANFQADITSMNELDVESVDIDTNQIETLFEETPKYETRVQSDDEYKSDDDGVDIDRNQIGSHVEETNEPYETWAIEANTQRDASMLVVNVEYVNVDTSQIATHVKEAPIAETIPQPKEKSDIEDNDTIQGETLSKGYSFLVTKPHSIKLNKRNEIITNPIKIYLDSEVNKKTLAAGPVSDKMPSVESVTYQRSDIWLLQDEHIEKRTLLPGSKFVVSETSKCLTSVKLSRKASRKLAEEEKASRSRKLGARNQRTVQTITSSVDKKEQMRGQAGVERRGPRPLFVKYQELSEKKDRFIARIEKEQHEADVRYEALKAAYDFKCQQMKVFEEQAHRDTSKLITKIGQMQMTTSAIKQEELSVCKKKETRDFSVQTQLEATKEKVTCEMKSTQTDGVVPPTRSTPTISINAHEYASLREELKALRARHILDQDKIAIMSKERHRMLSLQVSHEKFASRTENRPAEPTSPETSRVETHASQPAIAPDVRNKADLCQMAMYELLKHNSWCRLFDMKNKHIDNERERQGVRRSPSELKLVARTRQKMLEKQARQCQNRLACLRMLDAVRKREKMHKLPIEVPDRKSTTYETPLRHDSRSRSIVHEDEHEEGDQVQSDDSLTSMYEDINDLCRVLRHTFEKSRHVQTQLEEVMGFCEKRLTGEASRMKQKSKYQTSRGPQSRPKKR